jgi:hypothetical protein
VRGIINSQAYLPTLIMNFGNVEYHIPVLKVVRHQDETLGREYPPLRAYELERSIPLKG